MDYVIHNGELYHYGVLGMKWGVRRASRKSSANEQLAKKAYKYDKKAAILTKKAEKIHAKNDLERSNRAAIKAATYTKKAAKINRKALSVDDGFVRTKMEKKAAKLEYKAAKSTLKSNRLSKSTGYSAKAMKYSIKSDKVAVKAAKARKKIAANKAYISMMDRKLSSLSTDKLRKVETPIAQLISEYVRSNTDKNKQ